MTATSVYDGSEFSVALRDGNWVIWRFVDDGERIEEFVLMDEAMDELAAFFAESYDMDPVAT